MALYSKILAALDSGDTRLAVARHALAIAHDNQAEVLFAHIVDAGELIDARTDIVNYLAPCKQAIEDELADKIMNIFESNEFDDVLEDDEDE